MMMPLAMLLLYLEITALGMIFLDRDLEQPAMHNPREGKKSRRRDN